MLPAESLGERWMICFFFFCCDLVIIFGPAIDKQPDQAGPAAKEEHMHVTSMINGHKKEGKNERSGLLSGAGEPKQGNQSSSRAPRFSWAAQGPDLTLAFFF